MSGEVSRFWGWYSDTGKGEPPSSDTSCFALHIAESGALFFRNTDFSHRELFFMVTGQHILIPFV